MEIVEVLKLLSRQYGMNLVIGKNVSGRVTVFLSGVDPWDALRTILETRDLAFVKESGLVKIMTAPDYEKIYGVSFGGKTEVKEVPLRNIRAGSAKNLLEPFKSRVGSLVANELTNTLVMEDTPEQIRKMEQMVQGFDVPLETRVYPLSYGSVEEVLPKIAALAGKDFGSVQADKRSNALLVTAPSSRIDEISKAVEALDVRNKAVLIEAKVLQIILNDSSQWGVNWQYLFSQISNGSALAGGLAGNFQTLPIESLTRDAAGRVSAKGVTGDLKITQLPHHAEFSSIINFLEGAGKTKMLSAPRIMALNNREASIHVGTKEPIITRNIVNPGSTTTQPIVTEEVKFESVGVKLAVTPSIGNDGYITLKIRPEVSAVESTVNTSNGSSIPIVRLSEAETSVVVKDGVGIVIGGLIEDREVKADSRVPFLGRIPLIGLPFRSRSKTNQKTELVFFLTPHLTSGDTPAPELEKLPSRERPPEKQLSSSGGDRP
jgi:general secretion pathway protein D